MRKVWRYDCDGGSCRNPEVCGSCRSPEVWCAPNCPAPGALLQPGGRLVFHTISLLVTMCQSGDRAAGRELLRPQRQARRIRRRGVEFHPGHGEWISTLRGAGLVIDALHELYAPPGAREHPCYPVANGDWSQRWPVEEIWAVHRPDS